MHTNYSPPTSMLHPAEILSMSVRWGLHCARVFHWRKGPFGDKQFSCPLWSQWGHIPLLWASVSSRYWSPRCSAALTIQTRCATKSLNLLAHYHLLSSSPPFIIPYLDQYCWLHCSISQKTSWIALCWLFSRIACFLNCLQCGSKTAWAEREDAFLPRHRAQSYLCRPHTYSRVHGYLSPPCGHSAYIIPAFKFVHSFYGETVGLYGYLVICM